MIRFLKCCFLFVRYITRVRAHRPATVRCILSASVLDLFSVCFVFVFYLFFICSSTCFILVHGLFPICHFRSFIRSPLVAPLSVLHLVHSVLHLFFVCSSFISRSLYTCSQPVANLFPICFARFPLVPHLFSTCAPFVLFSFIRHLFIPHTLDVYSPFVSCSPPLRHSMFSILL